MMEARDAALGGQVRQEAPRTGRVMEATQKPFRLIGCSELRETLGKKAEDERRLVELIEEVPLDSIYFHTHSYFLRHSYVEQVYPNDFAQWVAMEVRDHLLAERLAVVDPFAFSNLETLREELISVIDDHLSRTPIVPRVIFGSPFHFGLSRVLEVPTGLEVRTLGAFRDAIAEVDVSAIYFHVFEARHRLGNSENDFSAWVLQSLGIPELAQRLQSINPYQGSLERLRSLLVAACD
ncbi:MAG TPA: DUF5752 family protein, partial [Nitrospira sp.]|nr:DUF5752 family protein [Nitrospira sp.]